MIYLLYRYLFHQYFLNIEGIKLFAERCINDNVSRKATKTASILTTYVKVLKSERAKRRIELLECEKADRMDDGSYAIKRKKSRNFMIVVYLVIGFEIFLNYISTLIFIQGEGLLFVLVRWGLAIILALAGMLVTDGLLSKILPEEAVRVKGSDNKINDDDSYNKRSQLKRFISLVVLPLLLITIELAIFGVSRARALDIEGGASGGPLYYGFISLSMALPVIAGYFKWDSEQHGKLYQNTYSYHKLQKMVHILDLAITSTMKDIKSVVEKSTISAWRVFERFKLYKENYNTKYKIAKEDIQNHYCKDIQSFKIEALNRFGSEVQLVLQELENIQK